MDDDTTGTFVPGTQNEEDSHLADDKPEATEPASEPETETPDSEKPALDIAPSIEEDPNLF